MSAEVDHPPGAPDWNEVQLRVRTPNWSTRARTAAELAEFGVRAVDSLAVLLQDRNRVVREEAVKALGWIDAPASLECLVMALDDRALSVRKACVTAVSRLTVVGTDEVLLTALKDRELQSFVAGILACRKNSDALPSLHDALADTVLGRIPRAQTASGILMVVITGVVLGLFGITNSPWIGYSLPVTLVFALARYFHTRRQRSEATVVIAQAIAILTEVDPQPEHRSLIRELYDIARDPLHHRAESRTALRKAAARIDQFTQHVAQLPRPVGAQVVGENLPRAASAASPVEEIESIARAR